MPKSKNNSTHKTRVDNFKLNKKQEKMSEQTQQVPQMPEIKSIPVWSPDATIEITGYEWEAIQNALTNVQIGQQAAQSVMSRNIVNGTIKMDFEKLNAQTLQYEQMTEEEKAPYLENFAKAIENVRNAKPVEAKETALSTEILDSTGEPVKKAGIVVEI